MLESDFVKFAFREIRVCSGKWEIMHVINVMQVLFIQTEMQIMLWKCSERISAISSWFLISHINM